MKGEIDSGFVIYFATKSIYMDVLRYRLNYLNEIWLTALMVVANQI
jgi:hypothetical protein